MLRKLKKFIWRAGWLILYYRVKPGTELYHEHRGTVPIENIKEIQSAFDRTLVKYNDGSSLVTAFSVKDIENAVAENQRRRERINSSRVLRFFRDKGM